jgi:hypothetical protein
LRKAQRERFSKLLEEVVKLEFILKIFSFLKDGDI